MNVAADEKLKPQRSEKNVMEREILRTGDFNKKLLNELSHSKLARIYHKNEANLRTAVDATHLNVGFTQMINRFPWSFQTYFVLIL